MSVVETQTIRAVCTVDLRAVIEELAASEVHVVAGFVQQIAAEMRPDAQRALIDAVNAIEFVEVVEEEKESATDPLSEGDE